MSAAWFWAAGGNRRLDRMDRMDRTVKAPLREDDVVVVAFQSASSHKLGVRGLALTSAFVRGSLARNTIRARSRRSIPRHRAGEGCVNGSLCPLPQ